MTGTKGSLPPRARHQVDVLSVSLRYGVFRRDRPVAISMPRGWSLWGVVRHATDRMMRASVSSRLRCTAAALLTVAGLAGVTGVTLVATPAGPGISPAAASGSPGSVEGLDGVSCVSASACAGAGGSTVNARPAIVSTSDGGTTWATAFALPLSVDSLAAISCPSPSVCTAVGQSKNTALTQGNAPGVDMGPGAVVHTADGGATWASQSLPLGVGPLSSVSSRVDVGLRGGRPEQQPDRIGARRDDRRWSHLAEPEASHGRCVARRSFVLFGHDVHRCWREQHCRRRHREND